MCEYLKNVSIVYLYLYKIVKDTNGNGECNMYKRVTN